MAVDLVNLTVETMHQRVRSEDQLAALFDGGWPPFIDADTVAAQHLPRVRQLFADLEVVLVDREGGDLVASAWGVPLRWDGRTEGLPNGYSDSLARAVRDHDTDQPLDTLVICAAQVRSGVRGAQVAGQLVHALIGVATRSGLAQVIAPLRPTAKHRYPLIPINDYVSWKRPDGSPLDPWLRTHLQLGARVIGTAPASQVFTGSVRQWEDWTGRSLPGSGQFLVPEALAPLQLDHPADLGSLTEPGIWVQHR